MPARLSDQTMESTEFRYLYLQAQICFSSMPPEAMGIPSKKVLSFPVSTYLFETQCFHPVRIVFFLLLFTLYVIFFHLHAFITTNLVSYGPVFWVPSTFPKFIHLASRRKSRNLLSSMLQVGAPGFTTPEGCGDVRIFIFGASTPAFKSICSYTYKAPESRFRSTLGDL